MKSVSIDGQKIFHDFPFDPSYGYDLDELLSVQSPQEPCDFQAFWKNRYQKALNQNPHPRLVANGQQLGLWKVYELTYRSTDHLKIGGWALVPAIGEFKQGLVVGHGYGGRDAPDCLLPFSETALLFPCSRGLSRSAHPQLPSDPYLHVSHQIEDKDRYLIGGCVDDLWLAVSSMQELFPETKGNIGLLGISFSGGINMLAAPWDARVSRVHCNVPTFGHQALRSKLPSVGSSQGIRDYEKSHPGKTAATLSYFDAAIAATYMANPCHLACARFDPAVAPPGQFAIYNALPTAIRQLFILTAGHHPYARQDAENTKLLHELCSFFSH